MTVILILLKVFGVMCCIGPSLGTTYDRSSESLTAVPGDIPGDAMDLTLDFNQIATINSFPAFTNLKQLKLRDNLLTEFPDLSSIAGALLKLWLDNNLIDTIDTGRISALNSLTWLTLTNNKLTAVPDVDALPNCAALYLNSNPFSQIPVFSSLAPAVSKYVLSNGNFNNLNSDVVDLSNAASVISIFLSDNDYTDFPRFIGAGAAMLSTIYIQRCQIQYIDKLRLTPLTNVQLLELSGNPLKVVPDVTPLISLKWLYISGSSITSLSVSDINKMPATVIDVDLGPNDALGSLPSFCDLRAGFNTIDLTGLPLHCDCKMRWMKMALAAGIPLTLSSTPCLSPPALVGRTLDDISVDEMVCDGLVRTLWAEPINLSSPCNNLAMEEKVETTKDRLHCSVVCLNDPGCDFYRFDTENNSCTKFTYRGTVTTPLTGVISADLSNIYRVV